MSKEVELRDRMRWLSDHGCPVDIPEPLTGDLELSDICSMPVCTVLAKPNSLVVVINIYLKALRTLKIEALELKLDWCTVSFEASPPSAWILRRAVLIPDFGDYEEGQIINRILGKKMAKYDDLEGFFVANKTAITPPAAVRAGVTHAKLTAYLSSGEYAELRLPLRIESVETALRRPRRSLFAEDPTEKTKSVGDPFAPPPSHFSPIR